METNILGGIKEKAIRKKLDKILCSVYFSENGTNGLLFPIGSGIVVNGEYGLVRTPKGCMRLDELVEYERDSAEERDPIDYLCFATKEDVKVIKFMFSQCDYTRLFLQISGIKNRFPAEIRNYWSYKSDLAVKKILPNMSEDLKIYCENNILKHSNDLVLSPEMKSIQDKFNRSIYETKRKVKKRYTIATVFLILFLLFIAGLICLILKMLFSVI